MAQREKGQSQLDYLWVNFGKFSAEDLVTTDQLANIGSDAVIELTLDRNKLVGSNNKGQRITEVDLSSLVTGESSIIGSESKSLIIEVKDSVITGKLKIDNDPDSLVSLTETDKGLKINLSDSLNTSLNLIKNVGEDITQLKKDILILNGDENTNGSVLNVVTNNIQTAFDWQNF